MHPWIARNLVYYPIQFFRGEAVRAMQPEVEASQWRPREAIEAESLARVRDLVRHARERVPHYRDAFGAHGVDERALGSLADLAAFPVLTKDAILSKGHDLVSEAWPGVLRKRKTSGSTGKTVTFYKEPAATARNDAIMWRAYAWWGIGVGDRQARFWGVPIAAKPRLREELKDAILNRIRVSAFDVSPEAARETVRRMIAFHADYIYGYTTAVYGFALAAEAAGIDLARLPLKAIIVTSEKLYPHHVEAFRRLFRCPLVDEYGSSENGIIAIQCPQGGMHVMADNLIVEFVRDGRPVAPGEEGEILVTDLASRAMPLIRYAIGDVGRASPARCACDRGLPLMDVVEGRTEDFIETASGRRVHAAYLCYTLKDDAVREFRMTQKGVNDFLVSIARGSVWDGGSEARLTERLRSALGDAPRFRFEYVERIPREASGKLRYFVSEMTSR